MHEDLADTFSYMIHHMSIIQWVAAQKHAHTRNGF